MAKRIGEYLVEKGVLSPNQVQEILDYGRVRGVRFGDAGLEMGLLTRQAMVRVFGEHYRVDFFHLQAQYFPASTKDLLRPEECLRWGVLPLGIKTTVTFFRSKKYLNVGMLNPGNSATLAEIETLAKTRGAELGVEGLKVFLILADQLVEVLLRVYGVGEAELRMQDPGDLDETLAMYLESFGSPVDGSS